MISNISNTITKIIQDRLKSPNINIIIIKPDLKSIKLPLIAVYDERFKFMQEGVGSSFGERKKEITDEFNSDGKSTVFKLSAKPLRPMISVTGPQGLMRELDEYKIDYANGNLILRSPVSKGKKLVVKYNIASSEVLSLRLNIKYNIDIYASSKAECDNICIDVMKAIMLADELLISNNITMKPFIGANIEDNIEGNRFGKRLIYIIETYITTEKSVPIIEEIEIKKRDWEKKE